MNGGGYPSVEALGLAVDGFDLDSGARIKCSSRLRGWWEVPTARPV
jgi:hypothetical protein